MKPKILVKHHKVNNMKVKEMIIELETINSILDNIVLDKDYQKEVVNKLVDETTDWLSKSEEEQKKLIYSRLRNETIILYLHSNNYMPNSDGYSVTENDNGDLYINSFTYTNSINQNKIEGVIKNGK